MKRLVTNLGLLQIFFSLLLVISIMFVSTFFVYRNSISGIYEKVNENNTLVVKSIVQTFDNSFRTVNNIIHSIHNLPPYGELVSADDDRLEMTKVYTLVENLATLKSMVDYIEEVVVFYDNVDLAITASGTSSFQLYFNNKYKHEIYNANYWRTYSLSKHSIKLFPADEFRIVSNQQSSSKELLVTLAGNKVKMSNKNIMMILDVQALMMQAKSHSMIPGASLIVLDQDRNVILSTDKDMDLVGVLNDVYFNTEQEASVTRENYEYNFYKSDYNGFIYINKVPYQFQNLDSVAKANSQIMWTAIICAIVLSIFISVYLNRPVNNILRLLGGGHSKGNDFRKIYSGIVKLQSENELFSRQNEFVDVEIRRGVFLQTLDAYSQSKQHDILMQRYYPEFFRYKHFILVVIDLIPRDHQRSYSLPVELLAELLQSGLKRELVEAQVIHTTNTQFITSIGISHAIERDRLVKKLNNFIQRAEKEEFMEFRLWACVSRLYTSEVTNNHRAYREIMNGKPYWNVNDSVKVLDVEDIRYVWSIHFPIERMEKLSNYVISGKVMDAIQIIKETMKENIDRNIHHHQLVHIVKTMFFYLLRHAGGSANTHNELYQLENEFSNQVDHMHDYQDIENALIEVTKQLAALSKNEKKSKLNAAFVSQYIELHYMENLYLDQISEVMETSPKYFSNYFKKTFGINYVEYLNKVRLSHARELLKESSLSIGEIGERTGYLNSSTFTTTFKKYLGVSPSEYRKQKEN